MWLWLFALRLYVFHLLWLCFLWRSRVGGYRGTEKPCEEAWTPKVFLVGWKDLCWIYHQPCELSKSPTWSCLCLWGPSHLESKHQGPSRWSERCRAIFLLIHAPAPYTFLNTIATRNIYVSSSWALGSTGFFRPMKQQWNHQWTGSYQWHGK